MNFVTRQGHEVERTKGDPGALRDYRNRVRSAATMMESLAEMIDSFTAGKVQGEGFTVAAIRQNAGENSRILAEAAKLFDAGGAAHGGYSTALEQNQSETSLQALTVEMKHITLVAAEDALATALPEEKPLKQAIRDECQRQFDAALDQFDKLVDQNYDDQNLYSEQIREAAAKFHEETRAIDGFDAAAGVMSVIAGVAAVAALVFGGPIGALAWGAGAVSAGMMAKLWLDGERPTSDLLLEAAGVVPIVGIFGDAARLGKGVSLVDDMAGIKAAGIEITMSPEAARAMRRDAVDWAQRANAATPPDAAVPLNRVTGNQPLFSTVPKQHPVRGGTTQINDFSTKNLQSIRASLPPEKLNDPRFDPTHPGYFGISRGEGISGPVQPNASPSVSGLTNKGALIDGDIPAELRPYIEGPDSPLVLDYGKLRVRDTVHIEVPGAKSPDMAAELDRQLALTENGTNDTSVRDALRQLEQYRGKADRIDPHSTWKSNMIEAYVADEVSRGGVADVARAEAKARFANMAGIHSPDQVGGGDGFGVAGWGTTGTNGAISQVWPSTTAGYAQAVRSRLEAAGIPESLWDDIRMNVQFDIADIKRARVADGG